MVVETIKQDINYYFTHRPKQKDVDEIVAILERKPDISRALLRYAQYLAKQPEDT